MLDVWSLFSRCLWLFLLGGGLGVIVETIWWRLRYGFWQAHFALLWLPLCTVYGFGAVVCYLGAVIFYGQSTMFRFVAYALAGTLVEFVGGFLLDTGLKMRAWDYRDTFLNIRGYVNGLMTVLWGFLGLGFACLVPGLNDLFSLLDGPVYQLVTVAAAAVLLADVLATSACLVRWSKRHQGMAPKTKLDRFIDRRWDDKAMARRFVNWHFTDEPDTARSRHTALNLQEQT